MAISQKNKVSPPSSNDLSSLRDFASVVQDSFDGIYEVGHTHGVRTTEPTATDGKPGDIMPVVIDSNYYLYAKFAVVGWKRVLLS